MKARLSRQLDGLATPPDEYTITEVSFCLMRGLCPCVGDKTEICEPLRVVSRLPATSFDAKDVVERVQPVKYTTPRSKERGMEK